MNMAKKFLILNGKNKIDNAIENKLVKFRYNEK